MRLTSRGRYAVTAMLDLALNGDDKTVALADVAARQGISVAYLEQIFAMLRRAGLVVSVRGPGGGYRLAQPTSQISVTDIIDAVSDSLQATSCRGRGNCQGGQMCLSHHLWHDLTVRVHDFLGAVSLASLAARQEIRRISRRQDLNRVNLEMR